MENQFDNIPNIPNEEIGNVPPIQVQNESFEDKEGESMWIDFQSGDDAEGIKSAGMETYVISPVTEKNLFSDKYLNCTGVVGIGKDKLSGKEVAFISHQDPEYFVHKGPEYSEKFKNDLKETLNELVARSESGTVEVVIFGGKIDPDNSESKKSVEYVKSIDILNGIIRDSVGRSPAIVSGPIQTEGAVDVTVLTQERKISIVR